MHISVNQGENRMQELI